MILTQVMIHLQQKSVGIGREQIDCVTKGVVDVQSMGIG